RVVEQTGLQDESYLDNAELARATQAETGVLAIPVDVNRQRLSIIAAYFGAELVFNAENPSGTAHMPVLRLHNPHGGHYQAMIPQ
ncbi:MAG: hypothetical protein O3A01_02825, partial [bacterium]|nr:hypothetical protein [bacterium]